MTGQTSTDQNSPGDLWRPYGSFSNTAEQEPETITQERKEDSFSVPHLSPPASSSQGQEGSSQTERAPLAGKVGEQLVQPLGTGLAGWQS